MMAVHDHRSTYGFGSSSDKLAGAYGTAVSTTMLLTTALLFNVMRDVWRWPLAAAVAVTGVFLVIDLAFFGANLLKLPEGGYIPLLLGLLIFGVMTTWHRGIEALRARLNEHPQDPAEFLARLQSGRVPRVPGTAVFLSGSEQPVPPLLVRHVAQFKALQETAVSLTVHFVEVPRVEEAERASVTRVAPELWHVAVSFGFVEIPALSKALQAARAQGCPLDLNDAIYFAGHDEVVRSADQPRLPAWRRLVFAFLFRNAVRAPDRFDLPTDRFLEVARQVAL